MRNALKYFSTKAFGIVYIVYCGESVSCSYYLRLAAESAKTFRSFSSSLPIAIITSFLGNIRLTLELGWILDFKSISM